MDAVIEAAGYPERLWWDLRTENVHVADMKRFVQISENQLETDQALEISE